MRAFWIVVGVLMLLSAGYLFYKAPAGLAEPQAQVQSQPVPDTRVAAAPRPREDPPAERLAAPGPPPPGSDSGPEPASASRVEEAPEIRPEGEPSRPIPIKAKPLPDTQPALPPLPATAEVPKPPAPEPAPATPAAPSSDEPRIVRNEDGSMLVDGRYRMRGSGTPEDPYTVTWDQLTSIQDEYAPKDGRNVIPARIKMLDGKHVRVEGNIAFPMMMDEAEECLVMLNQWDGCCIGVPPTPYDAIEVKLNNVVTGDTRMTTYGTITGRFRVDPHLVGGWLVGLYVMEQSTLRPQAFGGFAP
jgi:hypothetical protein